MLNQQTVESSPTFPTLARQTQATHAFKWSSIAPIAILLLCAVLPYLNSLHNDFVYDDVTQILNNPYLRNFQHLREILTTNVWSYRGGAAGVTNYYRPLMLLSYLICYLAFGAHALAFHALNVALNAAVVILVFKTVERLFEDRAIGFATAAMFALHPIHTEPVAWIAALTDLELTFFYLLTFRLFLELSRVNGLRLVMVQAGMAMSFALALLSKEPAVTLPLLATGYEHLYRNDRGQTRWPQKFSRYIVLWALNIAYFGVRIHFLGGLTPHKGDRMMLPGDVLLAAFALVGQYVWKFFWPVKLCAFYLFPDDLADSFGWMVFGCVAIVALAALSWLLWKRVRLFSFGCAWFFLTLAPVLNIAWMPASALAERYLYLPSVGLCWILAWGLVCLFRTATLRSPGLRFAFVIPGIVLTLLCVFRIFTRNRDWHDDVTFYTVTLAASPKAFQMINNLGEVYYNKGDLPAAEREWLRAKKLWPNNGILLDNLGLLYTDEQRYDEAVDILQESLRVEPKDASAHMNLGTAYVAMGKRRLAEQEFKTALALAPLRVTAHDRLGDLYFAEGRYAEAAEQFRLSLESVATTKAYLGEGLAYWRLGKNDKAEADLRAAQAISSSDAHTHFVLALFYGETGKTQESIREYQEGFKIDPDNREARAAFQRFMGRNAGATTP